MVKLTIDGIEVSVKENTTILAAAKEIGIKIPTLCYLPEINEIGACRICMVENEGSDRLLPACETLCTEGMVIRTNSPRVRDARRVNLRLILSQHNTDCTTCLRNGNCELQDLCSDLNVAYNPYSKNVSEECWPSESPLVRDESKCIKCMRCINVCEKTQSVGVWDLIGTGGRTKVGVAECDNILDSKCVFCGQCVTHCPVGALTERDDTEKVFDALKNPEVKTVVQVAPAVRAAWADHLGIVNDPRILASALKKIGFDYVFDTNFSADLTIMEEGSELIERLKNKENNKFPMFTSCCPGWVNFVNKFYPELAGNLSTAKSPQQMFGAVAKSYFAEKAGIDPHKMFVVSIMPCVAKKGEAADERFKDACGDRDVDVVLTTRELERLVKEEHIDVNSLEPAEFDSPLGEGTGAAVIFGATGGVLEAALRTVYYVITGKNPENGMFDGLKKTSPDKKWRDASISLPGVGDVKVAVTSGLANVRALLEAVKSGKADYDFIEIMACPGGCAGGGGQPIILGEEKAKERGDVLWKLDENSKVRFSHENECVKTLYAEYLGKPLGEKAHKLLHC